jgi:hypothetical protein
MREKKKKMVIPLLQKHYTILTYLTVKKKVENFIEKK